MSLSQRIRVLCVDDHAIVRQGVALLLGLESDMAVVGSAASGEQAVELFIALRPDVTLMDLQLPGMSGLEAIGAIRRVDPGAPIVVLTMYRGDEDIFRALDAGAATYLLKDTLTEDLVQVIKDVHAGKRFLRPDVQARLDERHGRPALTAREVQVIELLSVGMRNREIAAALNISEETAHAHLKNVFAKLQVTDRTAAVHVALQRGIIQIQ